LFTALHNAYSNVYLAHPWQMRTVLNSRWKTSVWDRQVQNKRARNWQVTGFEPLCHMAAPYYLALTLKWWFSLIMWQRCFLSA